MARKKQQPEISSFSELQARCRDLEKDIFILRNELALNRKLDKPHLLKAKRKDKARLLTLLTQRQKEGATT